LKDETRRPSKTLMNKSRSIDATIAASMLDHDGMPVRISRTATSLGSSP
jgi:hypothetical protein